MQTVLDRLARAEDAREAIPLIAAVVVLIFTMAFVPLIVLFLPTLLM